MHAGEMEWVLPKLIWHQEDLRVGQCYPNYYVARLAGKFAGILMVSPLYLPKLVARKNKLFNLVQIILIIVGYICGFGMVIPEILYGILLLYGVFVFSIGFLQKGMIERAASTPNTD